MPENCWEIKKCLSYDCPVHSATEYNGINHGENGGRLCWFVSGTFCGGEVQGTYAKKKLTCLTCEVYKQIKEEEKGEFCVTTLSVTS